MAALPSAIIALACARSSTSGDTRSRLISRLRRYKGGRSVGLGAGKKDSYSHGIPWNALRSAKNRLDGLVALVTGASRGLGEEAAVALSDAGAEVVLLSRTRERLERVANRISTLGGAARILVCDVTDAEAMRSQVESLERLDVLVNNTGMNIPEPFLEVSEERLDRQLALNVRAAFVVAQTAVKLRKMLEAPNRRESGGSDRQCVFANGRTWELRCGPCIA